MLIILAFFCLYKTIYWENISDILWSKYTYAYIDMYKNTAKKAETWSLIFLFLGILCIIGFILGLNFFDFNALNYQ